MAGVESIVVEDKPAPSRAVDREKVRKCNQTTNVLMKILNFLLDVPSSVESILLYSWETS